MDTGAIPPSLREELLHRVQIEVLHSGRLRLTEWRYRLCSPFWRLYWNDRPGASIDCHNRRWDLKVGVVYLIPAWVTFSTTLQAPVGHDFVHFALRGIPKTLHGTLFPAPIALRPRGDFAAALRRWSGALGREPGLRELVWTLALVSHALARAIDRIPKTANSAASGLLATPAALVPALAEVDRRLDRPPSVAVIAERCRVSQARLTRLFRRHLGVTPARYGRERRLAVAAHLLSSTDQSIDEIADAVGFSDRFHLTRSFRAAHGMPPAAFRRLQRPAARPNDGSLTL